VLLGLRVEADRDAGHPAEPLYARVARRASSWGPGGTVGLVVGATAPAELAEIRGIAAGLAFLVPGVGAQGGDEAAVLRDGRARATPVGGRPGAGLLVNISRGIAGAGPAPGDAGDGAGAAARDALRDALTVAARGWAARLPVLP
jgi:orotidine-5'-phosphate decarboxylase